MINALFNCALADPWLSVTQNVTDLNPVYWIAFKRDPSLPKLKKELPSSCYLQYWDDAWHGNGYPDDLELETPDQHLLEKYASFELIALQMMDRLDPDRHSFSLLERRRFFRYLLSTAHAIIKKYKIDLVISPSIPHRIHDYVLYAACKTEGIPFIMFQHVSFKSHSYIIEDIGSIPSLISNYKNYIEDAETQLKPEIKDKIDKLRQAKDYIAPDYMVKQNVARSKSNGLNGKIKRLRELKSKLLYRSTRPVKLKQKNLSIRTQYFSRLSNAIIYIKREIALKTLFKEYHYWVSNRPIRERPYILVALHYQPEETTSPSGGTYSDQTLIIELLHNALDPGIDIIVKEHKSQFNNFGTFKGERGRLPEDYKHIANISERVRFVSADDDPFKLIDNAMAIATVTGTIGYESALRGTPVLFFGRAWFEGMPRTHRITSVKKLKEGWPAIVAEKSVDLHDAIIHYHKNLQSFLIFASHYRETNSKPLIDTKISVNNIIEGLAKYRENSKNDNIQRVLSPFINIKN